jgi:hypothetical protein
VGATTINRRRCDWTRREDLLLIDAHSRALPVEQVAAQLGRTACSVYLRSRVLGLRCGAPEGYVSITVLAREMGYEVKQLRRVLAWAHVGVCRGWSNPSTLRRQRGGKVRARIVDRFDAQQAVAAWHRTATVQEWAHELQVQVSHDTLLRRARRLGYRPFGRRLRCHYRLTREQFESLTKFAPAKNETYSSARDVTPEDDNGAREEFRG